MNSPSNVNSNESDDCPNKTHTCELNDVNGNMSESPTFVFTDVSSNNSSSFAKAVLRD